MSIADEAGPPHQGEGMRDEAADQDHAKYVMSETVAGEIARVWLFHWPVVT